MGITTCRRIPSTTTAPYDDMIDPVLAELALGALGGLFTLPTYALLWPLLLIVTALANRVLGYGTMAATLGFLLLLPFCVGVMGIPMYLAGKLLEQWQLHGMELQAHIVAGRTYSAKSFVYFIGWAVSFGSIIALVDKLPPLRRLSLAWNRWVDRIPG